MPNNGVPDDFEEWMRDIERRIAQLERLPVGRGTQAVPASGSTPSSGGDISTPSDSSPEGPSTTAGP